MDRGSVSAWHRGPLVAFDLETTGVDVETARIVTACVALIDGTGQRPTKPMTWLLDPGIEIPLQATNVHGITTARARADGRPAAECVAEIVEMLFCHGAPIVAFNAAYDLTVLDREMRRHSVGFFGKAGGFFVIDPFVLDKHADRYRKGKRNLAAACEHYGVRLDGAHDATHDALAAARLAWKIAQRHPDLAAMDLFELHALQTAAKASQDASFVAYLRRQARTAKTAEEQVTLADRAEQITGHWPLVPYARRRQPAPT